MKKGSRVKIIGLDEVGEMLEDFQLINGIKRARIKTDEGVQTERFTSNLFEPLEMPEKQKKIFENIKNEAEENHGLVEYHKKRDALIKENIPLMREYEMAKEDIYAYFRQAFEIEDAEIYLILIEKK